MLVLLGFFSISIFDLFGRVLINFFSKINSLTVIVIKICFNKFYTNKYKKRIVSLLLHEAHFFFVVAIKEVNFLSIY